MTISAVDALDVGTLIGLALLNEGGLDVVLLDYMMTGINGIETLRQIRPNPKTSSIPVIMLTGVASHTMVTTTMREGANDLAVKPSHRETITGKIRKLLVDRTLLSATR